MSILGQEYLELLVTDSVSDSDYLDSIELMGLIEIRQAQFEYQAECEAWLIAEYSQCPTLETELPF